MSELSYFFDGNDKSYGSESFASMFQTVLSNGVMNGFGNNLNPSFGTNMTVLIDTGRAWIKGRYYENTSSLSLSIPTANATNPRIDRVILRLDVTNRNIVLVVKTGTPALSPVNPSLQQDNSIYEIPICSYTVAAGATLPTSLVDERQYGSLIGVDTTSIQITNLSNIEQTGWIPVPATLTYASATVMNSNINLSIVIPRGAKFRYKQGGNYKYGYLINSTSSSLTVISGSDYVITNTSITEAAWSISDPAVGFPQSFNFSPIISAYTGTFTTLGTVSFSFYITNQILYFDESVPIITNGTANGNIYSTLPIPVGGVSNYIPCVGREVAVVGKMLNGEIVKSSNQLAIWNYDISYPGGNGYVLVMSGRYPI